jgi:proliferating cell nuclear antigen
MLRFHFRDARVWRYMIASIEKILDEGVFVATPEGISLRALDTSHIVMVDLLYPSSAFVEFTVERDVVEVGVSFGVLSKVLRRATKNDELVLELKGNSIVVELKRRGVRRFRIPLIHLTYEKLPEPKIAFTVKAKMLGSTFRDVVRILKPIADSVTLKASEDGRLTFIGRGDVASGEVELSLDKQTLLEASIESPDEASYTMEYFEYIAKASQVADTITIQYAQEAPVRVDLEYADGGRLTFYVSPRVD